MNNGIPGEVIKKLLVTMEKELIPVTIDVFGEILRDIDNGKYQINSGIHLAEVDEREAQIDTIKKIMEKWVIILMYVKSENKKIK